LNIPEIFRAEIKKGQHKKAGKFQLRNGMKSFRRLINRNLKNSNITRAMFAPMDVMKLSESQKTTTHMKFAIQ